MMYCAERALEVTDRARDEELRVPRRIEIVRDDAARRLLFEAHESLQRGGGGEESDVHVSPPVERLAIGTPPVC